MCKKLMFLISLVLLLGIAGNVVAADIHWTNAYIWSMTWDKPLNWQEGMVPTSSDTAYVRADDVDPNAPAIYPGQGPVIDELSFASAIRGPSWDSDLDQIMLCVQDCNLQLGNEWRLKEDGSGTGTIEIMANAYVKARFQRAEAGTTIINMSDDAYVFGTGENRFVRDDSAIGIVTMTGNATWVINGTLRTADSGLLQMTVADNALLQIGDLRIGDNDDGVGEITQTGGTVDIGGEAFIGDDGSGFFDISGGTTAINENWEFKGRDGDAVGAFYISGDANITVGGNIEMSRSDDGAGAGTYEQSGGSVILDGDIRLLDGSGIVTYEQSDGLTWADGDMEVVTGGGGSVTVNISGGVTSVCNLYAPANNDGGFASINLTGGLLEVRCGEFGHDDDTWHLEICGGTLQILGDHYAEIYAGLLDGHISACGGCGGRADLAIDYNNVRPGWTTVWAEENLGRAWDPSPTCGETGVGPIVELCWEPGESECPFPLDFHVFFSEDFEDVNEGNLHAWQGVITIYEPARTCFTTEPLCLGKTYYWRIESVFDCCYYPGQVWSFTVVDSVCVEDMEAYDAVSNPIWETWLDGCGDQNGVGGNGTGSCVYTDTAIKHGGDKSMLYYYDCSGQDMSGDERDCNYAIATRAYAGLDISSSCAEALELWFYGDPANDATALEAMFLTVGDGANSATATYGDTAPEALADMQVAEWQQWDIALSSLSGVDLTNIVSMSLGFGDVTNCHREKGGYGVMRLDDICIFPCRCVPKYTPDIVDLNDDCVTNWLDIKLVADNWLEEDLCNQ